MRTPSPRPPLAAPRRPRRTRSHRPTEGHDHATWSLSVPSAGCTQPALVAGVADVAGGAETRISQLNQHFNEPGKDIAPWMFVPESNIKELSTEEHPGLATIYEAGKGQDIKGLLKDPIRIGDYRLPWEFQTSLVQSFNCTAGVGAKTQVNYGDRPERRRHVFRSRDLAQPTAPSARRRRTSFSCWSSISAAPARRASACRSSRPSRTPRLIWSGAAATWATR